MFKKGFKECVQVNQMKRYVFWHSVNEDVEVKTTAISGAVKTEKGRQAAVGEGDTGEVGGPVMKGGECQGKRVLQKTAAEERHNPKPPLQKALGLQSQLEGPT